MSLLKKTVKFQTDIQALDEFGKPIAVYRMRVDNSATDPQDMMFNLQRALEQAGREVILGLNEKSDGNCSGGQSRQVSKPSDAIPRQDQKPDADYLRHGDEGPIRCAEAAH